MSVSLVICGQDTHVMAMPATRRCCVEFHAQMEACDVAAGLDVRSTQRPWSPWRNKSSLPALNIEYLYEKYALHKSARASIFSTSAPSLTGPDAMSAIIWNFLWVPNRVISWTLSHASDILTYICDNYHRISARSYLILYAWIHLVETEMKQLGKDIWYCWWQENMAFL